MGSREFQFDLSAGEHCLDFANTSASRKAPGTQVERLLSYADLLAFGVQAGLLTPSQSRELSRQAYTQPSRANAALRKAYAIRDALYRVFSAIATHRTPPYKDLEMLNAEFATAIECSRIVRDDGRFIRVWADTDELELPLWPIAASANGLLTSGTLGQLRECPAESCSWLFVDQSRNQSRRWCDMKTCGNRAKARRHYERAGS